MPFPGYDGWIVQIDPDAVASGRTMLDINNPSTGIQIGDTSGGGTDVDWGQSSFTQLMAQEGQWGSAPADFIVPNRTITITLGLGMGGPGTPDADSAMSTLAQKVGLLQREGGWLLRQRAGGDPLYADIVDAQLTPMDVWSETAGMEPGITLTLTTLPDFYGDEIALDSIPCTGYCDQVLTLDSEQANIEGDYPGRCILTVTSTSGLAQEGLAWAFRSRYGAADGAVTVLAANIFPSSGASYTTLTGAYNGHVVETGSLTAGTSTQLGDFAVDLTGVYRVFARCYCPSGTAPNLPQVRLTWLVQGVNTNFTLNAAANMQTSGFSILDLGVVNVPSIPAGLGGGDLFCLINAVAAENGQTVAADMIWLQPLDEYAGILGATLTNPTDGVPYAPIVLPLGDATQIRTEGPYLSSDIGYQLVPSIGKLPRVPCSGAEGRPVELFVKQSRALIPSAAASEDVGSQDLSIDQFTAQVSYRPCYLAPI